MPLETAPVRSFQFSMGIRITPQEWTELRRLLGPFGLQRTQYFGRTDAVRHEVREIRKRAQRARDKRKWEYMMDWRLKRNGAATAGAGLQVVPVLPAAPLIPMPSPNRELCHISSEMVPHPDSALSGLVGLAKFQQQKGRIVFPDGITCRFKNGDPVKRVCYTSELLACKRKTPMRVILDVANFGYSRRMIAETAYNLMSVLKKFGKHTNYRLIFIFNERLPFMSTKKTWWFKNEENVWTPNGFAVLQDMASWWVGSGVPKPQAISAAFVRMLIPRKVAPKVREALIKESDDTGVALYHLATCLQKSTGDSVVVSNDKFRSLGKHLQNIASTGSSVVWSYARFNHGVAVTNTLTANFGVRATF